MNTIKLGLLSALTVSALGSFGVFIFKASDPHRTITQAINNYDFNTVQNSLRNNTFDDTSFRILGEFLADNHLVTKLEANLIINANHKLDHKRQTLMALGTLPEAIANHAREVNSK